MSFDNIRAVSCFDSPLGMIWLAASEQGLCGLWFDGQKHQPSIAESLIADSHPILRSAQDQVLAYFAGEQQSFDLPLDLRAGTSFQQSVWQSMLEIEHGQVQSYAKLSHHIGRPKASRAVGAAVGRNPISIIVPCHRVLATRGALQGYAGGLERKRALLAIEARAQRISEEDPGQSLHTHPSDA